MTTAPQWKLRRLAPRAIRVHERRAAGIPALMAFGSTLVPIAKEFMDSYDGVQRYSAEWRKQMREGRSAIATLTTEMRSWLPRLGVDIPQFDRSTFADSDVPDDIMEDAQRLLETVEEHQELAADESNQLEPLPYAEQLQASLAPLFEAAAKEWREADASDSDYQQALAKVRGLARDFERELVAFRATLSTAFDRSDADYQKLRTARAATPDPEDDANAPQPTEIQAAAE